MKNLFSIPLRPRAKDGGRQICRQLRRAFPHIPLINDSFDLVAYGLVTPKEVLGKADSRPRPLAVMLPETSDEVARILRFCWENDLSVSPRGSDTGNPDTASPLSGHIILSLTRLRAMTAVDRENRRIKVGAGVTLPQLETRLAGTGLVFPYHPRKAAVRSLGGLIAQETRGLTELGNGRLGEYVLGLTCVLPQGETITLGGGHLDPSGLDLVGLMLGSGGSLGIVTEAILRLVPASAPRRTAFAALPDPSAAMALALSIKKTFGPLETLLLLGGTATEVALPFLNLSTPPENLSVLFVSLAGERDVQDQAFADFRALLRQHGSLALRESQTDDETQHMWQALAPLWGNQGEAPHVLWETLPLSPQAMSSWLAKLSAMTKSHELSTSVAYDLTDGTAYLCLSGETPLSQTEKSQLRQDLLHSAHAKEGKPLSHGQTGLTEQEGEEPRPTAPLPSLQQATKQAFDPKLALGTGKPHTGEEVS